MLSITKLGYTFNYEYDQDEDNNVLYYIVKVEDVTDIGYYVNDKYKALEWYLLKEAKKDNPRVLKFLVDCIKIATTEKINSGYVDPSEIHIGLWLQFKLREGIRKGKKKYKKLAMKSVYAVINEVLDL